MPPTIKDIAKQSGVSISTVSRVFNNQDLVKNETKQKVLEVIEALGYTPNFVAKRLRSCKISTIGIVVPDISAAFYAEIIKGVENKANDIDCGLIVCDAHNSRDKEKEYVRYLYDGRVDGMIFVVPQLRDDDLRKIAADGLAIAVFGKDMSGFNIQSISVDNYSGAYQAVKHLYFHGHKRIAYIGGIEAENDYDHRARLAGYRQALIDNGLGVNDAYIENGAYCEEGGGSAFLRLIKLNEPPDAIFCANDEMALGVIRMARKNHIEIPEQLGLIGFDNIRVGQYISPSLTTVNQPTYTIGVLLGERLIFQMTNKEYGQKTLNLILKPELVIRESCGC